LETAQKKQLLPLLDELVRTVEELLLAGLTAASKSTIERIDVSFKEASRMRLLRLGSTLRIANEEIARFNAGSQQFSARRLAFFLGRTWLLATALRRAIDAGDDAALDRLLATPASAPIERLRVVTLGVSKRVVPSAFASFEFRLRAVEAAPPVEKGEAIVWSCVFPMRKDLDLPAEAFLQLPQKQKFRPSILLERNVVEIARCAVVRQADAVTRLNLGDASELKPDKPFEDWRSFWRWDLQRAAQRLESHRPTPLDLEIELQEEVVLDSWEAGERRECEEGYDALPILTERLAFEARLDRGPSGTPLNGVMTKLAKQKKGRPPLFGVAHYEACRMIFQPLTALGKDGPEYLTVSPDKISQAELVRAMKFT
jgi:hypothetical protein